MNCALCGSNDLTTMEGGWKCSCGAFTVDPSYRSPLPPYLDEHEEQAVTVEATYDPYEFMREADRAERR